MILIVKSAKTQVNIHNEMYLNKICYKMTIRKFCITSLITSPFICSRNCSVKVGDVAILCLLKVIPISLNFNIVETVFQKLIKLHQHNVYTFIYS